MTDPGSVTALLAEVRAGRKDAAEDVLPLIYAELHRIAERHMRGERANHTLQATSLVHDAFLKLINQTRVEWQDRAHFLAVASQAMRRLLVDHARARLAARRGAGAPVLPMTDSVTLAADHSVPIEDLLALDDALDELAALDARQARVVELRYFGGLEIEEAAEALSISPATLKRDWAMARAWLHRRLAGAS